MKRVLKITVILFNVYFKIKALEQELQETKKSALQGMLVPLPGETIELSTSQLGAASKAVATAMAQLLTAATQVPLHGEVYSFAL